MEKLFWGMVGGCTVAFAILLGMYLNKAGVIGAEPETATELVSETETETETEGGLLVENGELPADIQSLIEDSQTNYSQAMKVFEDESSEAASREAAETQKTTTSSGSTPGTSDSNPKTNGSVDANRNDNHDYFLESPTEQEEESESESEEASTEQFKPEEKKSSEYEYTLFQDHVAIKKYVGSAATLDVPSPISFN